MLKAIFSLFIAFIVIILGVFLAIGAKIYRSYNSMKRSWSKDQQDGRSYDNQQSRTSSNSNNKQTKDSSKIIGDDEGEYVDFEEEIK